MAQSLSNVLLHTIFSTKDRAALILPDNEIRLHNYIRSVCEDLKSPLLFIGGMPDHIHILSCMSRNISIADFTCEIKSHSSKFMKTITKDDFTWQKGYGVFSVGESGREKTIHYIANQKEHHKVMSFQEEFVSFLKKYKIEYNENFLWN